MITYLHVEQKAIQNISILKQNEQFLFSATNTQLTKIPSVKVMSNLKGNIF